MKFYEEYGSSFPEGSGMSKFAPVPNLTYTQALLLLALPAEEREEFLAQKDVAARPKPLKRMLSGLTLFRPTEGLD